MGAISVSQTTSACSLKSATPAPPEFESRKTRNLATRRVTQAKDGLNGISTPGAENNGPTRPHSAG